MEGELSGQAGSLDIEPEEAAVPGHRNYLVYCDESGINGEVYYGFGSLWMPWERRGDFQALLNTLRTRHGYRDEIKWHSVNRYSVEFYLDLLDLFFRRTWLMFHAVVVRRGYTNPAFHKDWDQEKQKRFAMLIKNKVAFFSNGDPAKAYHVRVDPLPSRYKKADEVAFKVVAATLRRELGLEPVKSLITRNSKETVGIQVADLLLGATLADWQGKARSDPKRRVRGALAEYLGWPDTFADTHMREWKFNIWYFKDPTDGLPREVPTRPVQLKIPMPLPRKLGK